jgi:hypothetical protein
MGASIGNKINLKQSILETFDIYDQRRILSQSLPVYMCLCFPLYLCLPVNGFLDE